MVFVSCSATFSLKAYRLTFFIWNSVRVEIVKRNKYAFLPFSSGFFRTSCHKNYNWLFRLPKDVTMVVLKKAEDMLGSSDVQTVLGQCQKTKPSKSL